MLVFVSSRWRQIFIQTDEVMIHKASVSVWSRDRYYTASDLRLTELIKFIGETLVSNVSLFLAGVFSLVKQYLLILALSYTMKY